jgi:hypothetical protein
VEQDDGHQRTDEDLIGPLREYMGTMLRKILRKRRRHRGWSGSGKQVDVVAEGRIGLDWMYIGFKVRRCLC